MAIRPTLKEFKDYIVSQSTLMVLANKKATRLRRNNRQSVIDTSEDYTEYTNIRRVIEELDVAIKKHEKNIQWALTFSKCLYPFKSGFLKQFVRRSC